jgi:peptide/nickel transport system substrate-binding protein
MTLTECGQPMSKSYAEEAGEEALGTNPVGVGPFRFASWEPGVKVVLERNPDFTWGPAYTHGGPPYIETLEIRGIVDHPTRQAALEAGEIDLSEITIEDTDRITSTGQFEMMELIPGASADSVYMNLTRAPFDDIRVRKALNMAIDRDLLIKVMFAGEAEPMVGILSPATIGYCEDAAKIGYHYDLEAAKDLMAQAGYTPGEDGMLQKDGEPLVLVSPIYSFVEKLGTVLQEQYKALGVQIDLQQGETNAVYGQAMGGDFDIFLSGFLNDDATMLNWMFASYMVGGYNFSQLNDPVMDEYLSTMTSTTDPDVNSEAACQVQVYAVEQAYTVPLYVAKLVTAVNSDLQGVSWKSYNHYELFDAYYVSE